MVAGQEEEEVGKEEAALVIVLQEDLLRCIRRFATNADKIVKCLLGQPAVSLFIAVIVSRATEISIQEIFPPKEDHPLDGKREKCLKPPAMNVEILVRFLFNQAEINLSTAVIVLGRKKAMEREKNNVSAKSKLKL